jgi:hypothetical protein
MQSVRRVTFGEGGTQNIAVIITLERLIKITNMTADAENDPS